MRDKRPPKNSWTAALRILSRRAQSEAMLFEKLKAKGVPEVEIPGLIQKAKDYQFLDDGAYARMLIRRERQRGRGVLNIRRTLKAHGINAALANETAEAADLGDPADELARAQALIGKKIVKNKNMEPVKAFRFLLSRGFAPETARKASKFTLEIEGEFNE